MAFYLVCIEPAGDYELGQVISDQATIANLEVNYEAYFVHVDPAFDLPTPPSGFVYLHGADAALLQGADGAILFGVA